MTDFPTIDQVQYVQNVRPNQRNILPTAVKNRQLSSKLITESTFQILGPVTFSNGAALNITSTIVATDNPLIRVGAVPYMIAFAEGTSPTSLVFIPFQLPTATDYLIFGPMTMPVFTGTNFDGSSESNLVIKTTLVNVSGGNKTVMVLLQGRYILDTSSGVADI
jgi:hypothetical protein